MLSEQVPCVLLKSCLALTFWVLAWSVQRAVDHDRQDALGLEGAFPFPPSQAHQAAVSRCTTDPGACDIAWRRRAAPPGTCYTHPPQTAQVQRLAVTRASHTPQRQ
jgi:hypothetical protein